MAFVIYFFVLIISAATAMVSLDLLTETSSQKIAKAPIGRIAMAPPPAKQETSDKNRVADRAALSPIYPATPGVPDSEARQDYPSTTGSGGNNDNTPFTNTPFTEPDTPLPEQSPSSEQAVTADLPTQTDRSTAAPSETNQLAAAPSGAAESTAAVEPAPAENPSPGTVPGPAREPAAQQTNATCNVSACADAYRSFRASDCTYQPFEGPRRLCSKAGGGTSVASTDAAAQRGETKKKQKELREVERVVRGLTERPARQRIRNDNELREVERIVREMTRGEGPVEIIDGNGNIIVIDTARPR